MSTTTTSTTNAATAAHIYDASNTIALVPAAPAHEVAYLFTVNAGRANERVEAVRPLQVRGTKVLVAYTKGVRVDTKWVAADRVQWRAVGEE